MSTRRTKTSLVTPVLVCVFLLLCFFAAPMFGQSVTFIEIADKSFVIEAKVIINERGGFVKGYPAHKIIAGDTSAFEVIRSGLASFESEGYFKYLAELGVREMALKIEQDGRDFKVTSQVDVGKEIRARSIGTMVAALANSFKSKSDNGTLTPKERNEIRIISNIKVSSDQSTVLINFALPKAEFWQLMDDAVASLY